MIKLKLRIYSINCIILNCLRGFKNNKFNCIIRIHNEFGIVGNWTKLKPRVFIKWTKRFFLGKKQIHCTTKNIIIFFYNIFLAQVNQQKILDFALTIKVF